MRDISHSRHKKQENRSARLYISTLQVLIDGVTSSPTLGLQIEELTPTLILPRETCLDLLMKHSLCAGSQEQELCYLNPEEGIQSESLIEFSNSPGPFLNRLFSNMHHSSFLEQEGYVSFPSLDLYTQDKRPMPVRT